MTLIVLLNGFIYGVGRISAFVRSAEALEKFILNHPELFAVIESANIENVKSENNFAWNKKKILRNFISGFNVAWCKEGNFWESQVLMFEINTNGNDVGRAWMIKESTNISIEIGIKAMLQ